MVPSARVIVLTLPVSPAEATKPAAEVTVYGGQIVAQVPVQLLTPGVSLAYLYKVMPFDAVRKFPKVAVEELASIGIVAVCWLLELPVEFALFDVSEVAAVFDEVALLFACEPLCSSSYPPQTARAKTMIAINVFINIF